MNKQTTYNIRIGVCLAIFSLCIFLFLLRERVFNPASNEQQSSSAPFVAAVTSPPQPYQSELPRYTVPVLQFDENGIPITTQPPALSGLDETQRKIIVSDEEFYPWILEIYENIEKYSGYEITITGAVYSDFETMSEYEFVPARYTITPGDADLIPIGFLCYYEKTSELIINSWVTVTGTIEIEMRKPTDAHHHGQDEHDHDEAEGSDEEHPEPIIIVSAIEKAELVEGYIHL